MRQLAEREFVRLFSDAHPRLWTLATAILNDRTAAEDIVQEAAIVGLKKREQFDAETSFVAWMSQIVRFTALNHLKKRKSRNTTSLESHTELNRAVEPESNEIVGSDLPVDLSGQLACNQQAFDDDVVLALGGIEDERRVCLLLRVVHDLTYEEIAEITGIPEGTAMSHVHRAKSSLRKALKPPSASASESPSNTKENRDE